MKGLPNSVVPSNVTISSAFTCMLHRLYLKRSRHWRSPSKGANFAFSNGGSPLSSILRAADPLAAWQRVDMEMLLHQVALSMLL